MGEPAEIVALREAVKISPDNGPLRQLLADALLNLGRGEDAERECRQGLTVAPSSDKLKTSLARAFYQQGKNSEAIVLTEALVKSPDAAPEAHLLYARLLINSNQKELAGHHYRKAIEANPSLADMELASRLGATAHVQGDDDTFHAHDDEPQRETDIEEGGEAARGEIERPAVRFKDVGGMEAVKDEIRMKIIHPLEHAELYKSYGKKIGGGILMYGPPGCGKTYLARATAGEINARFMAVGISDVLDMWIGSSERNLHALFEQARQNKPCVLFFDEVDALAASRADLKHSGAYRVINQFLAELDGIQANNDGLLILAATNAPWHVDSAFRRPGRFDRILFVPPPDAPARAAILRIMLTGKPIKDVDYDQVAKKAEAFSGADLKAIVDMAIEAKLKQAMRDGIPQPLTTRDLLAAMKDVKASTREWFASARNYALYSNQGGVYDDVLKYLKM